MSENTDYTNNSNELSDTTGSATETSPEVEAARCDVEQTRANIGETLDEIKEKLDPHALLEDAKQTVSEVASNTMEKAKETVHDVVADVATNAKEAVTGAVSGVVDGAKSAVGGVVDGAKDAVGGAVASVKGAGSSVVDLVKRNPMPAALIGLGAAWLYLLHRDQQASNRGETPGDRYDRYDDAYAGAQVESQESGGVVSSVKETVSHVGQKLSQAAGAVREQAGDLAGAVAERAGQAKDWAGDAVHSTVDYSKDFGAVVVDIVRKNPIPAALTGVGIAWMVMNQRQEGAGAPKRRLGSSYYDSHGRLRRRVERADDRDEHGNPIVETAAEWKDKAAEWGSEAWEKTSQVASSTAGTVQSSFFRNPLPIGLAVLGLGAAAGLLMPGTQVEDRWMGETRDRLTEEAKEKVQEVVSTVQDVAGQTVDTARETMKEKAKEAGLTMDTGQPGDNPPGSPPPAQGEDKNAPVAA